MNVCGDSSKLVNHYLWKGHCHIVNLHRDSDTANSQIKLGNHDKPADNIAVELKWREGPGEIERQLRCLPLGQPLTLKGNVLWINC